MPELDDAALERRLRGVLKEHLGALPLDLTVDALDRRREAKGVARRSARGRGITLLAAAALLLVGGALAAGSGILRLPAVIPPVPEPSVIAVATAAPDATSPSPSESAAPSASPIPVAGPGGVWIPTGTMGTPRYSHNAVRLLDGRVLVVGGRSDFSGTVPPVDSLTTSAELYDPATGTWSATGNMLRRTTIPAVLLRDGTVLVGDALYNPASGTWTATGPMVAGLGQGATVTVLRDGKVLVAKYEGAQLFDPASGTWTATGRLNGERSYAAATLLSDGKVLVAGGVTIWDSLHGLDSAEVYDPVTGSWTPIANMHAPHAGPLTATLLRDGKVLVTGSNDNDARPQGEAEIYDPATGAWTVLPARPGIRFNSATLLSDGTVLVAGHVSGIADRPDCAARGDYGGAAVAELYDPRSGSWTTASSSLRCAYSDYYSRSFTPLLDGTVLVAGGGDCNGDDVCVPTGSALYVPTGVALPPLPAFPSPPPIVFPSPTATPSPTPRPTPLPPAAGPVPPNARSWTVTVDNESSEPATLFVAMEDDGGTFRLVGSATPNVVPAGTTVQVTFRFPAKADGWIYVNPRPGEGGSLVNADQIGIPGKIWIGAEGDGGWLSP